MESGSRLLVQGPLERYEEGFGRELVELGYSEFAAEAHLYLMGHLSRWLGAHGLSAGDLDTAGIGAFLADRRASGQIRRLTPRGLIPLIGFLRGLGVAPPPAGPVSLTPVDEVVEAFVCHLVQVRGLASGTVVGYRRVASRFLGQYGLGSPGGDGGLGGLSAGVVNEYILARSSGLGPGSLNNEATALRALLRFLFVQGLTANSLAGAVPRAPAWRGGGLPRAVGAEQVAGLLASCDLASHAGCRDYAILVVLWRLGLRANEVATLGLDDVNWREGEIRVRGKGNRNDLLPLPVDVGQAIADYARRARRRGRCRALFLHTRAPFTALSSSAVSAVVTRASQRAGLPRTGAHQLRHTAASDMRRAGAPLLEIGQVLRHSHAVTTALYARDDLDALAVIARPWPAGRA